MDLIYALIRTIIGVALVVLLTRANGLRSFSKMSGFDFALTLAIGSTLASIAMAERPGTFWVACAAMVALYALQAGIARGRKRWVPFRERLDNQPILLMEDGEIIEANLARGNVARGDLMAKLREANVLRMKGTSKNSPALGAAVGFRR